MSLKTTIVTDSISASKKLIQCVCDDLVYEPDELLLQCTVCKHWLHGECIGLDWNDKPSEDNFVCVFCGTAIVVVQSDETETDGIHNIPVWNEDSDHIVCCCDEQNENGFMIQCERCWTWQHGECMGIQDGESPMNYRCHICRFAKIESVKPIKATEGKDEENKEETKEEVVKPVDKSGDCLYVCKICDVEFDNGRALIYHKSYEKCTPKTEPQEISSNNHNGEPKILLDNYQNGDSIEIDESEKDDSKSYPKTRASSKSILDNSPPTNECSISQPTPTENKNIPSENIKSHPKNKRNKAAPISIHKKTEKYTFYEIDLTQDVHVAKLQNINTEIPRSSRSRKQTTTVACGECSLVFPDTPSLKTHHKTHPKCSRTTRPDPPLQETAEDIVNCLCGSDSEKGLMIQCDICHTWQHTVCIGLGKKQSLPENYCCYTCMNNDCFSLILQLSNVTVEDITEKFHQKIVREGRKRKDSQPSLGTFSDNKKRKHSEESYLETDQSDEAYSPSESSLIDEPNTGIQKVKTSKTFTKKDHTPLPVIRSSTTELAAINNLLSSILSKTRLFTQLFPHTSNFKSVTLTEVLELLPTPLNFPNIEITSDTNETVHSTPIEFLSSITYPHGNQHIINVGASVTSMAWVPAVFNESLIYLSVTTQRNIAHKEYLFPLSVEIDNQTSDIVQIWSINNYLQFKCDIRIALGLVLKQGKVTDMQWCPSGCFDDDRVTSTPPRLGLLLVALNTGELGIISVPHPTALNQPESDSIDWFDYQFYEVCFDMTLELEDTSLCKTKDVSNNMCLCCDWSLQNSHNRIVAGFQTGVVAVWNLKAKLYCKNNRIRPILVISAHATPVVSVVWSPQHPYLFATASHDSYTALVWDMRQTQIHAAELNNIQVSVTWCMCWPLNYLRPICGIEVLPKKNEFSWYGNLFTNSFRSIDTVRRLQLSGQYTQCPTFSSMAWCRKDCSLLTGSFSGELLFLYYFNYCNKSKLRHTQVQKLVDVSIRSDEDINHLSMRSFDIERINAVTIDFDFSSFHKEEAFTEFKCADLSQVALIKRLTRPTKVIKSSPGQFQSKCDKCGKQFQTKGGIRYHKEHDVCQDGSIIDNRGNFFKPCPVQEPITADQLMLKQIKSKKIKIKNKNEIKKMLKSKVSIDQSFKTPSKSHVNRERNKNREKPQDKYQESSYSQIKQVKWFPCEPFQNVFAIGTGLGLIMISSIPDA